MPTVIESLSGSISNNTWTTIASRPSSGSIFSRVIGASITNVTDANDLAVFVRRKQGSQVAFLAANQLILGKAYLPLTRESWSFADTPLALASGEILEALVIAQPPSGEDSWEGGTDWEAMDWRGGMPDGAIAYFNVTKATK